MSAEEIHLPQILIALQELVEDTSVPKNVKTRIQSIVTTLSATEEFSIKVNRALDECEQIVSDLNLMPHTRTQIWNVVSLLESSSN